MCDLFQANPWKPLLCTNCHQNRSGHEKLSIHGGDACEHRSPQRTSDLPSSSSSMHLYEEIMAQYFTINSTDDEPLPAAPSVERIPTPSENDPEEDSFSDEEQELTKPVAVEFVQNQSMINTNGIVLMGPELPAKEVTKKSKKIHLLRKSKSNADDCLKKTEVIDGSTTKSWWFKAKKSNPPAIAPPEPTPESNKSTAPSPNAYSCTQQQRVRVLPEINKLTLNEALNIARRQHASSNREPKLPVNNRPFRSPATSTVQANYGSSIASTTSSSTQSSTDYDGTSFVSPPAPMVVVPVGGEAEYLTATEPKNATSSMALMLDKINKLTIERIAFDLGTMIDEYKHNLPVARFQTLKSFLHQHQASTLFSNEAIYFLLLQMMAELSYHSSTVTTLDHFLIAHQSSSIPIIVTTTSSIITDEESVVDFIEQLAKKLFDTSSLPTFHDLSALETICYRYLFNQLLPCASTDRDHTVSMQRMKLLDLFWSKVQSLRHVQINEDNERFIFTLYYLMQRISQSDSSI